VGDFIDRLQTALAAPLVSLANTLRDRYRLERELRRG
jgi:hypothetical protein